MIHCILFRFTKILTIGAPIDLNNDKDYGNFDMSQLVIYFRALTDTEMAALSKTGLGIVPLECCSKRLSKPVLGTL